MACSNCSGTGKVTCPTCDGDGKIRNTSYIPILSEISTLANDWQTCPNCHGSGEKKCSRCNGTGNDPD